MQTLMRGGLAISGAHQELRRKDRTTPKKVRKLIKLFGGSPSFRIEFFLN